jgi:hypothetical protein
MLYPSIKRAVASKISIVCVKIVIFGVACLIAREFPFEQLFDK